MLLVSFEAFYKDMKMCDSILFVWELKILVLEPPPHTRTHSDYITSSMLLNCVLPD